MCQIVPAIDFQKRLFPRCYTVSLRVFLLDQRPLMMQPTHILRLEGAVLAAVAAATYFMIGGPIWLFVVLALAPDISMLAYLGGTRVGSTVYNTFHTYLAPATLGVVGV